MLAVSLFGLGLRRRSSLFWLLGSAWRLLRFAIDLVCLGLRASPSSGAWLELMRSGELAVLLVSMWVRIYRSLCIGLWSSGWGVLGSSQGLCSRGGVLTRGACCWCSFFPFYFFLGRSGGVFLVWLAWGAAKKRAKTRDGPSFGVVLHNQECWRETVSWRRSRTVSWGDWWCWFSVLVEFLVHNGLREVRSTCWQLAFLLSGDPCGLCLPGGDGTGVRP